LDLGLKPIIPRVVKSLMLSPGCVYIDGHGALLNTADVLLASTDVPWNGKAIFEEYGRNCGTQENAQVWNKTAQGVEHRHDLRGMAESMS